MKLDPCPLQCILDEVVRARRIAGKRTRVPSQVWNVGLYQAVEPAHRIRRSWQQAPSNAGRPNPHVLRIWTRNLLTVGRAEQEQISPIVTVIYVSACKIIPLPWSRLPVLRRTIARNGAQVFCATGDEPRETVHHLGQQRTAASAVTDSLEGISWE
jgi:hypothetical protein